MSNYGPALNAILANMAPNDRANLVAAINQNNLMGGTPQVTPGSSLGPTGQRFRLWNNYYSIVRFQAVVSTSGSTTTLSFQQQSLRPFSYRIGDQLAVAGFDGSFGNATEAETNLVKAGETIAGEMVQVDGISLMLSTVTDLGLAKQLFANMAVVISMDGDSHRYRLGRPDMIPCSGGLQGNGPSPTLLPPLNSSLATEAAFSNGWPTIDNFYPFPQPLFWTPSGETDSNFNIVLTLVRPQVVNETARTAASGVAPYTPPTAAGQFGTFVDVMCRLHSQQVGPRSVNQ
jgi:hypothetical protein